MSAVESDSGTELRVPTRDVGERRRPGIGAGVRRLDVGLLRPGRAGPPEDVDGAGARRCGVRRIAVDAPRAARLSAGPDSETIARERHRAPEEGAEIALTSTRVRCLEIGLLRPRRPGSREHVDGACVRARGRASDLKGLVTVDAPPAARLEPRADRGVCVAGERHRVAEAALSVPVVRRLDVRLRRPRRAASREDVGRACFHVSVRLGLVEVDSRCGALLLGRSGDQRVAGERDRRAERSVAVTRPGDARVGRLEVGLLGPCQSRACEDVDGSSARRRGAGPIAVDAFRAARFAG